VADGRFPLEKENTDMGFRAAGGKKEKLGKSLSLPAPFRGSELRTDSRKKNPFTDVGKGEKRGLLAA